jgi:hypothetical protein
LKVAADAEAGGSIAPLVRQAIGDYLQKQTSGRLLPKKSDDAPASRSHLRKRRQSQTDRYEP